MHFQTDEYFSKKQEKLRNLSFNDMKETMDIDLIVKDPHEIVNILNDQIFFKNSFSKFQVSVIKQFGFLSLK